MTTRLKILLLLTALPLLAAAQYKFYYPELYIGTNQGVALWNNVGFDPEVEQNFDVRYHGGITVRYIIQKYFGIQAELNYTQRGWSETSKTTGERYDHRLDYLELPLVTHIFFGPQIFKFYINLGPKIRYMIYDVATAPFSTGAGVQQTKPIDDKFDYSIFAGVGFEVRPKNVGSFFLEARFDYGLGNIFTARKGEDFARSNNIAITISVGYMFNVLSKKKKKNEL